MNNSLSFIKKSWQESHRILRESSEWPQLKPYLSFYQNRKPTPKEERKLLNQVWDDMGLDSFDVDKELLNKYYQHPIWLQNGLWIESDDPSLLNRWSLAQLATGKQIQVLDYGGGIATVGKLISLANSEAEIDVYAPFSFSYTQNSLKDFLAVKLVGDLGKKKYDYVYSVVVLEHIQEPIQFLLKINPLVKKGGKLVIAWNFRPGVKAHLPQNFHLRYTLKSLIMPTLGFRLVKDKSGFGLVYKKVKSLEEVSLITKMYLSISEIAFPFLNRIRS